MVNLHGKQRRKTFIEVELLEKQGIQLSATGGEQKAQALSISVLCSYYRVKAKVSGAAGKELGNHHSLLTSKKLNRLKS